MSSNLLRRRDISKYAYDLLRCRIWPWRSESHGVESRRTASRTDRRVFGSRTNLGEGNGCLIFVCAWPSWPGRCWRWLGRRAVWPRANGVVISQVYGPAATPGHRATHDFIELFNRGTAPVVLDGSPIQYRAPPARDALGVQRRTAHGALRNDPARQVPPHPRVLGRQADAAPPATDIVDGNADRDGCRQRARSHSRPERRTLGCIRPPAHRSRPARGLVELRNGQHSSPQVVDSKPVTRTTPMPFDPARRVGRLRQRHLRRSRLRTRSTGAGDDRPDGCRRGQPRLRSWRAAARSSRSRSRRARTRRVPISR